ncbi:MAG: NUDIX domain-containing protein [Candidatus Berkelbacteria bacterium]|nr:NUDIX domain-containing protein [Candidatus Berkelbacteria bacterium]
MIKKIAVIVYFVKKGIPYFFVGKRPNGVYQYVTGHVEQGETEPEAARRELVEELGAKELRNFLNLKTSFNFKAKYDKQEKDYEEEIFAAEITDGKVQLEAKEFKSCKFHKFDEAKESLYFDSHKRYLTIVNQKILNRNYPKIFIIVGPAGAGKGSILQKITSPEFYWPSTVTTRERRPGEKEAHRFFVKEAEFLKMKNSGELIESCKVHRRDWYGSLYSEINDAANKAQNVLIELDINGAKFYKKRFSNAITIFIKIPNDEIKTRMIKRNPRESLDEIERRIQTAKQEQLYAKEADCVIENKWDHLQDAVEELRKIILKENC